jgi:hypothetical protein
MRPRLTVLLVLAVATLARAAGGAQPDTDKGYLVLGFDRLAGFKFAAPTYDPTVDPKAAPPTGDDQIPPAVKAWSGRRAMITGFMLPTQIKDGRAVEFLIMANQMACCFGTIPAMNEWVVVRMPAGVPVIQDVPISFFGILKVGAMYDNGYMTGIYEMDAERMGEVRN